MLAVDHGYFLGPTSGLEEPGKTVAPLLPYADSLMLTRGVLRQCIPATADVPIVLRVSGGTSILSELSNEGLTVDFEDAIRLNAAAVTLSVFVGGEGERTSLLNLARLIDEGHRYGFPVLAVTASKEMVPTPVLGPPPDLRRLGAHCQDRLRGSRSIGNTSFRCDRGRKKLRSATPPARLNAIKSGAKGVDWDGTSSVRLPCRMTGGARRRRRERRRRPRDLRPGEGSLARR
jgi:putative autoinducer-2 (AI-2) aldolase